MSWSSNTGRGGIAQHVIQRGYDRSACFFGPPDRLFFLRLLESLTQGFECRLHAYVLMGNHIHLLLTATQGDGTAGLMRALRVGYLHYASETRAIGDRGDRGDQRERAGLLLEDGFEASTIHVARHLLHCMRYIELNPVRAGMVRQPAGYRWSSYAANATGRADALVTPHPFYLALGRSPEMRQASYRRSVETLLKGPSLIGKL